MHVESCIPKLCSLLIKNPLLANLCLWHFAWRVVMGSRTPLASQCSHLQTSFNFLAPLWFHLYHQKDQPWSTKNAAHRSRLGPSPCPIPLPSSAEASAGGKHPQEARRIIHSSQSLGSARVHLPWPGPS